MHDEFIFEFIKWKQIHDMYDDFIFNHLANAMHFDFCDFIFNHLANAIRDYDVESCYSSKKYC